MDYEKYELMYNILYRVYIGEGITMRYTSSQKAITWGGAVFSPATIEKDSVNRSSMLEPQQFNLKCPVDELFVASVVGDTLGDNVAIEISMIPSVIDEYSTETKIYSGLVRGVKVNHNHIAEINLSDDSLEVKFPKFLIQPGCNHRLFSEECTLDKEDFKEEITITSLHEEGILYSAEFEGFAADYFTHGKVFYNGAWRAIVSSTPISITLNTHFLEDVVGKTVSVYPGCDKKASTCKGRFDNFKHFLGFTMVPKKNPIVSGIGTLGGGD
jgi:uncharacterized phage protein (TIGR02218 family)